MATVFKKDGNWAPEEVFALSKITLPKKEMDSIRDEKLPDGTAVDGEMIVKISFGLQIGQGYERVATNSVPWRKLCEILMSKVNDATLGRAVEAALQWQDMEEEEENGNGEKTEQEERALRAVEQLKGAQPKTWVRGRATVSAIVERVG